VRPLRLSSLSSRVKSSPLSLLLLAGVLIQGSLSLGTSLRELKGVRDTLGMPALWRGANFSQGARFADYILFLNENIPFGGRVVLPPVGFGPKALTTTPFMQFFLAPLKVINCTETDCAQDLRPENTYVLVVGDFPGDEAARQYGERRMFDEHWGLLLPNPVFPASRPQLGFERLVDILLAACLPLLWLGLLTLSGHLLVTLLARGLPVAMRVSLGYGLGLSLLTAGVSLVWLIGLPLSNLSILGITFLLPIGSGFFYVFRTKTTPPFRRNWTSGLSHSEIAWKIALSLFLGVTISLSVGQGYSVSDEIVLWGAKGYGIAAEGGWLGRVQDWGTNTVFYPLHIPILIASFKILFAETLPASKLVFPGYALALVVFTDEFIRLRSSSSSNTARLFVLLLGLSPLVFRHATIAYANLPLTFALVGGVSLAILALQQGSVGLSLLSGLLLAAAAWTRPEGLALALLCNLVMLATSFVLQRRLPSTIRFIVWFAPLAGYGFFWMVLKSAVYTQPAGRGDLVSNALAAILAGQWHLGEAWYILRTLAVSLFDPTTWGIWGVALLPMVWLYLRKGRSRQPQAEGLVLAGIVCLAAMLGMYYLTSYDQNHDISWWLSTGLERMLLPAMWMLWLGLWLGIQPFNHAVDRPIPASPENDRRLEEKL